MQSALHTHWVLEKNARVYKSEKSTQRKLTDKKGLYWCAFEKGLSATCFIETQFATCLIKRGMLKVDNKVGVAAATVN